MPIDPSIYSQLQAPKPVNQLANMAQAYQLQNAAQQNQLGQATLEDRQMGLQRKNRLLDLSTQYGADPEKLEGALLQGGFIDESSKLGKDRREVKKLDAEVLKTGAETEKFKLANMREKMALGAQILSTARDQASYDQARATAQAQGLDVSQMPPQFDPRTVQSKIQESQTIAQQLEQVWKQKGYDLEVNKAGESVRHNKATEGIAGGNLQVSRDRLKMDQNAPKGQYDADRGLMIDPRSGVATPVTQGGQPLGPKEKLGEGAKKQVTGIDALSAAIDEYKKELSGWDNSGMIRPDRRASMGSKYNNMMLQAKEAYNLGVLNGPDYSILTKVITDPLTMMGAATSKEAMDTQASELDRMMQRTRSAVVNQGKGSGNTGGATGSYGDAEKESRYQAWKAKQKP